jgi:hypothetical protein
MLDTGVFKEDNSEACLYYWELGGKEPAGIYF